MDEPPLVKNARALDERNRREGLPRDAHAKDIISAYEAGVARPLPQGRPGREAVEEARAEAALWREHDARVITMQDVRLAVGEGKLTSADVLAGCNAELVRRRALFSPAPITADAGKGEP